MTNNAEMLLLQQLQKGSIKAYEELFRRYYKPLTAEAYYLLRDEMEAEDQVQSLFIEMWDRQLYCNISSSVRSYLHTAIRNKCFSLIEKKRVDQRRFSDYLCTQESSISGNVAEVNETSRRVNAILNELPVQRLRAFSLVYLEDKKYREAAEEMGITINSVKTHLKLALKILQQKFRNF